MARLLIILFLTITISLSVFAVFPIHTASASPVLTENFNNNKFNSTLWGIFQQGNGPRAVVANQRLEITIPGNSTNDPTIGGFGAGLGSLCNLRGDFDMQVAFQLLVWPSQSGVRVGLGPSVDGLGSSSTPYAVERDSFSIRDIPPGEFYLTHMIDGVNGLTATTDSAGYLRITRTGSSATGYYSNGSQWIQIHTGPVTTSDIGFGFAAWSHDYIFSQQTEEVAFDNFTLNSGSLLCPTITLNPTSGPVGTKVALQGSGFPSPQGFFSGVSTVKVTFDDQTLGTTSNNGGSFVFILDVPFAQPGPHEIKAIDFATNTRATASFQVTASQTGLSVSMTVGTVYFPGDTVVANMLVTSGGVPLSTAGLQVRLNMTQPDNSKIILNVTSEGSGLFRASYSLPKTAQIGTYSLLAIANAPVVGSGSALASFEVKLPWLSSQTTTGVIAGVASLATVGVALVSWRKGYFKKSSKDPF
jgi:hypothetical protein